MIALIQRVAEASVQVRAGGGAAQAGARAPDLSADAAPDDLMAAPDGAGAAPGGSVVAPDDFIESGRIGTGLLALVCAERHDTEREADRLLERVLGYRVFPDGAGRMNRSLLDAGGALLVVSQFTLAADTASGTRPGFSPAAPAALGKRLYDRFVRRAQETLGGARVATGRFGADMRVALVNDGPVTFWLRVPPQSAA